MDLLTTTKFYIYKVTWTLVTNAYTGCRSWKQEDHEFEISLGSTVLGNDGLQNWTSVTVSKEQNDKSPNKTPTILSN